jgi:hypothetical protein
LTPFRRQERLTGMHTLGPHDRRLFFSSPALPLAASRKSARPTQEN